MIYSPVLFVGAWNEYELYQFASDHKLWHFDVMITHEYQRRHIEVLSSYLNKEIYGFLKARRTLNKTLNKIVQSAYRKEFLFILVKFLQKHGKYDKKAFKHFLNNPPPQKWTQHKPNIFRHFNLKKYYTTMIIDLRKLDGNKWNRFYGLNPNFFNQNMFINKALNHLQDDGTVVFWGDDYWEIMDYVATGYDEIEEGIYKKHAQEKVEYKEPRLFL